MGLFTLQGVVGVGSRRSPVGIWRWNVALGIMLTGSVCALLMRGGAAFRQVIWPH